MRKIEYFNGDEITPDVIERFKRLAAERFSDEVFIDYFSYLYDVEGYASLHEVYPSDEHMIFGEDWVFSYHISNKELILSDWIASANSNDKFAQSLEMYRAIRNVFLETQASFFSGYLRHTTSYPFYKSFVERGYIEEFVDSLAIDVCSEEEYERIADKFYNADCTLKEAIERDMLSEMEKGCIYHDVTFELTKKFFKRYQKDKRDIN